MDFFIGGLSAAGASIFSNPLDVLKTRMQLQGELKEPGKHAVHYRNVFHAAYVVAKNDGIAGLQKGLGPAIFMHFIRNSIRLGSYQYLVKNGYVTDENGKTILVRSAAASAFAGAAGAFFGSPLFLIKTQLQSQAARQIAVGHQHGHSGTLSALKQIYVTFGIKGLWRGVGGTTLRAVAGSSAQLTSFAMSKDFLRQYQMLENSPYLVSLLASLISGCLQTLFINPFDIVSTRIYNQGTDRYNKGLLYDGIVDCFVKIWRTEGFLGFYKGVGANYMRLAPHAALCLVFWDILKDLQKKYVDDDVKIR